jgi:hypothetical protein
MDSIQNIWDKTRKTAKFVGRHFFTLVILSLSIGILIFASLNWKNALIYLGIAITIDWVKQFSKPSKLHSRMPYFTCDDISLPPHIRQPWNPSYMGTITYASDNDFPVRRYD